MLLKLIMPNSNSGGPLTLPLDKANRINSDAAIEERKKAEPTQKTEKVAAKAGPAKTEVATSGTTSWF